MAAASGWIDVHQHLWPVEFVEELRARPVPPYLDGWILHLAAEPPYDITPADHDVQRRLAMDANCARILVSMSSPLGIELLDPVHAAPLLGAWHHGALQLPKPFGGWASICHVEPDLGELETLLDKGFVGLQVPATLLATPAGVERLAPTLRVCERADRAVLVHPGPAPARPTTETLPSWWAPVVDYPSQLQAAWWAWQAAGRALLPALRICFAAGAGLAPVHHERYASRTRRRAPSVDPLTFVETSSYGPRGVDALTRVLGIDVIVYGTDRPYAGPIELNLGATAAHAVRVANPSRLLEGDQR